MPAGWVHKCPQGWGISAARMDYELDRRYTNVGGVGRSKIGARVYGENLLQYAIYKSANLLYPILVSFKIAKSLRIFCGFDTLLEKTLSANPPIHPPSKI